MTNKVTQLATSDISVGERPQFWADCLTGLCGRLRADPYEAKTIDGQIEYGAIGRLKICQIEATRHCIDLPAAWTGRGKHPVVKVVLQTKGVSIFEQDGQRLEITPGDGLIYDVSRPHRITNPTMTRHLVVVVPRDLALSRGFAPGGGPQRFSTRQGIGRLASNLVTSSFAEMPALSPACGEELAEAILSLVFLPVHQAPPTPIGLTPAEERKQQIKSYIRQNLRDPDLCIEGIAAALHCTKRYLHMAFASEGTTIAKYIWMARLEQCRHDLEAARASDITITDVAFSWGFNSSSHFSRVFKEKFGVPPSHYLR